MAETGQKTDHDVGGGDDSYRTAFSSHRDLEIGAPTPHYDRLRDPSDWKRVLGERVRDTYSALFAMDPNIYAANEGEL
ncbi:MULTISPECIES: DUF5343 domain-containing protein [Cupriavidus]|uniref:DUF5343 domain-containing protein n=1 Tax=Cupriavidus TaxID=106589 RepID=UPI0034CD0C8C